MHFNKTELLKWVCMTQEAGTHDSLASVRCGDGESTPWTITCPRIALEPCAERKGKEAKRSWQAAKANWVIGACLGGVWVCLFLRGFLAVLNAPTLLWNNQSSSFCPKADLLAAFSRSCPCFACNWGRNSPQILVVLGSRTSQKATPRKIPPKRV